MRIDHVEICNFRNYEKAKLDFHEHINVLYGDNAQGKTNIFGIYICKWYYQVPQRK